MIYCFEANAYCARPQQFDGANFNNVSQTNAILMLHPSAYTYMLVRITLLALIL